MSRKKPRNLSPEDLALWKNVTKNTRALDGKKPKIQSLTQPKPQESKDRKPIQPFTIGSRAKPGNTKTYIKPDTIEQHQKTPMKMHRRDYARLTRGKLKPEGKIDLHGMTLAEAHPALTAYLMRAHQDGKRLVLVVTGKGRHKEDDGPIPRSRGLLKNQVPIWLRQTPLTHYILQVTEAHRSHGGSGAYYVYLRRN